jgi:thymidylate kinase
VTASIFFEGLPGTGKTELMVTLATVLGEGCLAIPETNPTRSDFVALSSLSTEEVNRWYLHRELNRDRLAASVASHDHPSVVAFDRSYLSVLAYCFAKSIVSGAPHWYQDAKRIFDTDIRGLLAWSPRVVLLAIPVGTSLSRRHDKQDREFESEWYQQDFLAALADFYEHRADDLCARSLVRIDADSQSQAAILRAALALVGLDDHLPSTESMPHVARRSGDEIPSPAIRRYFYANGGLRVFGQPVGDPVRHHGGCTQFFERHALLIGSGNQVELFDPLTDSRILARSHEGE